MTDVRYDVKLPPEIRAALAPELDRWAWLLPGWCRQLFVYYTIADADSAILSVTTNVPYRYASLFVHAKWLVDAPALRSQNVAHEFAHLVTAPLVAEARRLCDAYVPDGRERVWVTRLIDDALEGVVCDLEHALVSAPLADHIPPVP